MKLSEKQWFFLITLNVYFLSYLVADFYPAVLVSESRLLHILVSLGLVFFLLLAIFGSFCVFLETLSTKDLARRTKSLQWLGIFILPFFVGLAAVFLSDWYNQGLPRGSFAQRFDAQRWRMEESWRPHRHDVTPRKKMVGDAINTVVKNGNRQQILKQLGPPTEPSNPGEPLVYYLGTVPVGIEGGHADHLVIVFDHQGRVVENFIRHDHCSAP